MLWCLFLEWGWWFWFPLIIAFLALFVLLIRFLFLIVQGGRNSLSVGYEKMKVIATGAGSTGIVITVILILLAGWAVYKGYNDLHDNYFVALNTPGKELDEIRNSFQNETHVTISVKDAAKKFQIVGSYQGVCVPDLFESICRQYASQIFCDVSWRHRTLAVDRTGPK
jgi:membrane protein implicated in regulation of membrane protease activity